MWLYFYVDQISNCYKVCHTILKQLVHLCMYVHVYHSVSICVCVNKGVE